MKLTDRRGLPCLLLVLSSFPALGVPKVEPSVSVTEQYSDNIGLDAENEEDSFVHQITPGVSIEDSGAKTSYFASYRLRHSSYSNSNFDDRNEQSLSSNITRYELDRQLKFTFGANITNVETDIGQPRFGDGVSGNERTETITTSAGANYLTGKRQYYDLTASTLFRHTETDNDDVNVDSVTSSLNVSNGKRFNNIFWNAGGTYADDSNDNQKTNTSGLFGFNVTSTVGVFAQTNREDNQLGDNEFVTETWGVGVRINRARSSLSVAYNTFEEGGEEGDNNFISANGSWSPSTRTNFGASYTERFFGESFGFEANHQTRFLRQSLRYSDSVTDFAESLTSTLFGYLICPEGDQIDITQCYIPSAGDSVPPGYVIVGIQVPVNSVSEAQVLNRNLSYTAIYSKGKSTWTGTLLWNRSKILDDQFSTRNYSVQKGVNLSWNWRWGTKTTLLLSGSYRETENQDNVNNTVSTEDYTYRTALQRTFSDTLTGSVTLSHSDRRGEDSSSDVRENRISVSAIARF